MPKRSSYLEFVLEQLAPMGEITARSMFGGWCLYADGAVFALMANDTLYLKVDDTTRPEFEARRLEAFRPFEDQKMTMGYYLAPADIFEDPDAMRRWVGAAIETGRRAAAKKKPKAPSAKKV